MEQPDKLQHGHAKTLLPDVSFETLVPAWRFISLEEARTKVAAAARHKLASAGHPKQPVNNRGE